MQISTWSFQKLSLYHSFPLGLERIEVSHPLQHYFRSLLVHTIQRKITLSRTPLLKLATPDRFNSNSLLLLHPAVLDLRRSLKLSQTELILDHHLLRKPAQKLSFVFSSWVIALLQVYTSYVTYLLVVIWIRFQGKPLIHVTHSNNLRPQ